MLKFNPFKPGKIVHPAMFAGRREELFGIESALFQAKHGNPNHILIHGERGIGKSSLLFFAESIAQGRMTSPSGQEFNFITVNVDLDRRIDFDGIVRRIGSRLRSRIEEIEFLRTGVKSAFDFLLKWEVAGVKYNAAAPATDPLSLVDELSRTLIDATMRLKDSYDGIFLIIDEADKPSGEAALGELMKRLTESLTRADCNTLIALSGVSTVIDRLREGHESSVRIFTQFELRPLEETEAEEIVTKGLVEACAKSSVPITCDPDVIEWLAGRGSEGYPAFVQEYAYHAFEADTDGRIDMKDLIDGVYRPTGALEQLGQKYFEQMFLKDIRSDNYRAVLRVMAQDIECDYVPKQLLREKSGLDEPTLKNAISTLRKNRIILSKPGVQGLYKLPSRSFAVWIRANGDRGKSATGTTQVLGASGQPSPEA